MAKYKLMAHQREAVKFLDSRDGIGALLSCYVNGEAHYECAECEQVWPCKTIQVIGDAE